MSKCNQCGDCCKFLVFSTPDEPINREFLEARGCSIIESDGVNMLVEVDIPCPHLDDNNKCKLHGTDKMPEVCRAFPVNGQEKILPFRGYNT